MGIQAKRKMVSLSVTHHEVLTEIARTNRRTRQAQIELLIEDAYNAQAKKKRENAS